MKKGCLIGVIVFFALILIAATIGFFTMRPRIQKRITEGIIMEVELALEDYAVEFSSPPDGDHESVIRTLRGDNLEERNYFGRDISKIVKGGKVVDAWNQPLQIMAGPGGALRVRSAGPNGNYNDIDDVDSADLRKLVEEIRKKGEAAHREATVNQ